MTERDTPRAAHGLRVLDDRAGAPLHIERAGSGDRVVLLHSSGMSGRQWGRLVRAIVPRGLSAVVPDLTGHGASEPWPEPRASSFHEDVARVRALLASEGPAHLVGHSYGGLIALHATLASSDKVRSLSVYDPVAFGVLDPVVDADARASLTTVDVTWGPGADDRERWLTAFVEFWGGEGAWGMLREDVRAEFRRVAWVVREGVRSLGHDEIPAASYHGLRVPLLAITGEHSPLAARRVVERVAEAFPSGRTVTVPGAGHMGPLTHADAVNTAILDAITHAGAGPASP